MELMTFAIFAPALATASVVIAAALGISKIGTASVEGMARQPEASGSIRTGMIISAALIEGVSFFAVIVCLIGTNGVLEALKKVAETAAGQ